MTKRKLTSGKLQSLYRLMSAPMADFDCGTLCAPRNNGVPFCCDPDMSVPLLFRDELRWHRRHGNFWREMPLDEPDRRRLAEQCNDRNEVLALCPGIRKCDRRKRALVCRVFPFEPHCDPRGRILGLVYNYTPEIPCPLRRRRKNIYNPEYLRNAIMFWKEIMEIFPEERDLYIKESKKLRRRFRRLGRRVPVFR